MGSEEVKPPSLEEELIPAKQAAKDLGVHYNTLLRRIERKKIISVKIGYAVFITRQEIERVKCHP